MADDVFILGAGASADSGAPLMSNFLDTAEDLYIRGAFGKDGEAIKQIFDLIAHLDRVYAKSHLDLLNIEALFGAVEMGRLIGRIGEYDRGQVDALRHSMVTLIVRTLEESVRLPIDPKTDRVLPPRSYQRFVRVLERLGNVSVITFNYDLALDYTLLRNAGMFTYGLGVGAQEGIKLLKLHGSTNWVRQRDGGDIVARDVRDYIERSDGASVARLRVSRCFGTACSAGAAESTPVIVPPTWSKSDYHSGLSAVWQQAAEEIGSARNIYVVGYSLPESDFFFRYLFALGTLSATRVRRFWVMNPDESAETEQRFARLVGEGLRPRFKYVGVKFEDIVNSGIWQSRFSPEELVEVYNRPYSTIK